MSTDTVADGQPGDRLAGPDVADHEHWFHALWSTLGPYGPQDVHYHPCCEGEAGECWAAVFGSGRDCGGRGTPHERMVLTENGPQPAEALARLRGAETCGQADRLTAGPAGEEIRQAVAAAIEKAWWSRGPRASHAALEVFGSYLDRLERAEAKLAAILPVIPLILEALDAAEGLWVEEHQRQRYRDAARRVEALKGSGEGVAP